MSYKIRNKTTGEFENIENYLIKNHEIFEYKFVNLAYIALKQRTDLEIVFNDNLNYYKEKYDSLINALGNRDKEINSLKSEIEACKAKNTFGNTDFESTLRKENERMKTKVDQYADKISEILADKEIYINENLKLKNEKIEKFENFEILKNEKIEKFENFEILKNEKIEKFENFEILKNEKIENLKIIEKKNRKIENLQKRLKNKWEIVKDLSKANVENEPAYKKLQFLFDKLLKERKQLKSDVTNLCQENKSLLDRKNLIEESYEALRKTSRENTLNHIALIGKLEEQLKAKDKEIEGLKKYKNIYGWIDRQKNQIIKENPVFLNHETKTNLSDIDKNLAEMIDSGQSEIFKAILKKQYGV